MTEPAQDLTLFTAVDQFSGEHAPQPIGDPRVGRAQRDVFDLQRSVMELTVGGELLHDHDCGVVRLFPEVAANRPVRPSRLALGPLVDTEQRAPPTFT